MVSIGENLLIVNDAAALVWRLRHYMAEHSEVALITDENLNRQVLTHLPSIAGLFPLDGVFVVKPGEVSKSITQTEQLCLSLMKRGFDRHSLIVNLGGGVVTDLGGFVASVLKRGVAHLNIPTTLMAMVDASVGGKTAVNLGHAKNQVGTFHEPVEVVIWPGFLKWLPERELRSGFAECVKHGLLHGGNHIKMISKGLPDDQNRLASLIEWSVRFKAGVVCADPFEKDSRKMLNLGHTAGHAFEALSMSCTTPWLHGEAIAAGLLVALQLSVRLAHLDSSFASYWEKFLLTNFNFPPFEGIDADQVVRMVSFDKKNVGRSARFVLLKGPGVPVLDQAVPDDELFNAVRNVMRLIHGL